MNASKLAGRQLRARKEVCYNQEALELDIFSDEDDVPISLRQWGEKKKGSKNANRRSSSASTGGSEESASDRGGGSEGSEPIQLESSEEDGSGIESEADSETMYSKIRVKKSTAEPARRQPRRSAANRKTLKDQSTDSDSEASDQEEDGDSDKTADEQPKRSKRVTKRPAERSPARPARALRARNSARMASMAEPPSDVEEESEASGAHASEADDENEQASDSNSEEEGSAEEDSEAESSADEESEDEASKAKNGRTQSSGGRRAEPQRSVRASRPVRMVRSKPAAKSTSPAREEVVRKQNKPRINYASICKILDERQGPDGQELYIVYSSQSYRKAQWIPAKPFRDMPKGQILFRSFWNARLKGQDENLVHGILPEWLRVERIIDTRRVKQGQQYLTKWCGLPYTDATWESEEDLAEDQDFIKAFKARETVPKKERKRVPKDDELPQFLNGRSLRDYQVTSLRWMMRNQMENRNCILGDEMGLGKTAQSIATLEFQRQLLGNRGPFLVIAPLTTLGHWQREIITWTGMNVILYCGTGEDRKMIQEYEFEYSSSNTSQVKFDVLLTSYEMLLKDKSVFLTFGNKGRWPRFETVIIDEAHRMKNVKSSTRAVLEKMDIRWLLLLTGTPVQNNIKEVFGIMNLLDPERYDDEEDFYENFGGDAETPTVEQVRALQEELRPLLLRRMKEDVEDLPEKEEVIVWVELTDLQRAYYKALYSQQIGSLLSGVTHKNLPNLRNLAMELRKVCCHPYLCNSLEDNIADRHREAGAASSELERMIQSSGKMVLLHKLLPKLKAEGHKVLIFSQFKIMLDVIEDSLNMCGYPSERIDGSVAGRERQAAIDRFTAGGDDTFVFLLSTKAGGQGITLTAADTVIIFDSDWNPQNDLQAMARCHRIGQSKDVTIYRLVCRDTYEQEVFNTASRKYGLDEAILGSMNSKNPEEDANRIADLLKHGAHALVGKEAEKAKEGEAFAAEDINEILAGRTEKRQIGSRAGNTFSTAHFAAGDAPGNATGSGDGRSFWANLMPDAVAAYEEQKAAGPTPLGPRKRRSVNYGEGLTLAKAKVAVVMEEDPGSDKEDFEPDNSHSSEDSDVELDEGDRRASKGKRERATGFWSKARVKELEEAIVTFGANHFADIRTYLGWGTDVSGEEVIDVICALMDLINRASNLAESSQSHRDKVREAEELIKEKCDLFGFVSEPDKLEHPDIVNYQRTLAALKEKCSKLDARPLITDDIVLPATASQALRSEQTVARLKKNGLKYQRMMMERQKLAGFLKGLEAGEPWAHQYLRQMRWMSHGLNALERMGWYWSEDYDLALLVGSYKFGLWPHTARRSIENILYDPTLPTSGILRFTDLGPLGDVTHLENNLEDAPDLHDVLSWIRDKPYNLPQQHVAAVVDAKQWRRRIDMLVQRLKSQLKWLYEAEVPGPIMNLPYEQIQRIRMREGKIEGKSSEVEDASDLGSEADSEDEPQAPVRMELTSASPARIAHAAGSHHATPRSASLRSAQKPTHAATPSAGYPRAAVASPAQNLRPRVVIPSAGHVQAEQHLPVRASPATASKPPRAPQPFTAGRAARMPQAGGAGPSAHTPSKIGKENASQHPKKVASSSKKRQHDVVDLTCSPSPARPAKQPVMPKHGAQISASELKVAGGAKGKMKQAKLGFKTKFVGKAVTSQA